MWEKNEHKQGKRKEEQTRTDGSESRSKEGEDKKIDKDMIKKDKKE